MKYTTTLFALAFTLVTAQAFAVPPQRHQEYYALGAAAWQALDRAGGVIAGAPNRGPPNIQIVFDPNCPASAYLYRVIRRDFPHVPIRWVPIAYMRPDSAALAQEILTAKNPGGALDQDLGNYDFLRQRAGLSPLAGSGARNKPTEVLLPVAQAVRWGGYTPMVIFRNAASGQILVARHNDNGFMRDIVQKSSGHLQQYDSPTMPVLQ